MRNELLQVGLPPAIMKFYQELAKQRYQKVATVVREVLVDYYRKQTDQQAGGGDDEAQDGGDEEE